MSRRHPIIGDIVVIDYDSLNAISVCTDISKDQSGDTDNDRYRLEYLAAVSYKDGVVSDIDGGIWLYDDDSKMSIVGVNGCILPPEFYGLDTKSLLEDAGYKFN